MATEIGAVLESEDGATFTISADEQTATITAHRGTYRDRLTPT